MERAENLAFAHRVHLRSEGGRRLNGRDFREKNGTTLSRGIGNNGRLTLWRYCAKTKKARARREEGGARLMGENGGG